MQLRIGALQTTLQSQSSNLERLPAQHLEQKAHIRLLRKDFARLVCAHRTNAKDLIHIATGLVAVSQATGVSIDPDTFDVLRPHGWEPAQIQDAVPLP